MKTDPYPIEYFRESLKINKHDLDTALIGQPGLYYEVCQQHLLATSRADELKDRLRQKEAEISLAIRAKEESKKLTETAIASMVLTDPERGKMQASVIQAAREVAEWSALRDAYSQRAYVLKDLAGLFVAGYFSTSSVRGRDAESVRDASAHNRREELHELRQRTPGARPGESVTVG